MPKISNIGQALKFAKLEFVACGVNEPDLSAQLLLADVMNMSKHQLYAYFDTLLTDDQQSKFIEFIERRKAHEPIQYILGHAYFRGLKLNVAPGVLIPRPETEYLVELALGMIDSCNLKIIDLCTGSGCCAISIADTLPYSQIYAYEKFNDAINIAEQNIKSNNVDDRVELVHADIFQYDNYPDDVDMIISNPPYVPVDVVKGLSLEVKDYEPLSALEAGVDGNSFVPRIADIANNHLKQNGILCLELFEDALNKAAKIVEQKSFKDIDIKFDLAGKPRFLFAKRV